MWLPPDWYKQISVKRNSTQEPPIFLGPVFIHDNSDFQIISNFFNHLKGKLSDVTTNRFGIGSDEELALVNAITACISWSNTRFVYATLKEKCQAETHWRFNQQARPWQYSGRYLWKWRTRMRRWHHLFQRKINCTGRKI